MMSSWLFTHLSVDCTVIGEESKHGGDPFTYSIVIVLELALLDAFGWKTLM